MVKYSSLKRSTRVRFSVHLYTYLMLYFKYPDIIAITIFFIIDGFLYKYPSIFIYYLIALTVAIYIIYTYGSHKIVGTNLIKNLLEIISYINKLEKNLDGSSHLAARLKETEHDLIKFPKNKNLFSEKNIFIVAWEFYYNSIALTEANMRYNKDQEYAENALIKYIYASSTF